MGTARIYFRRNCRTRSRPRTRQLRTTLGRHRTSLHHFEVETLARFNSPKAQKRDSGAFAPYAPCAPCAPNPSRNLHTERPQSPFAPFASRSSSACGPCLKSAHMCTCAAAPAGAAKGHQRSAFVAGTLSGGVPCTHAVGRLPRGGACARAPRVRAPPLSSGAFQDARLALCFALPCAALRPRVPPLCTSSAPSMPDCPSTCAREEARCLSVREARQGGGNGGILFGFRASQPADAPKHGPQHQLHAAAAGGGAPARVHHRTPRLCTGKQARPAAAGGSR